jgi:hypothetical protein
MLALGFVQRCFGFRRRLLTPFAIPATGGLFALDLTALPLLPEIRGGLSGFPFADLGRGALRRLWPTFRYVTFKNCSRTAVVPAAPSFNQCTWIRLRASLSAWGRNRASL